jgi:beta-N-acetylhexosaminidase
LSKKKNYPLAVILGCRGKKLLKKEGDFFSKINPLGFILFKRNCQNPKQIRQLTKDLKSTLNRDNVAILIDQEGGRVNRLPASWSKRASSQGNMGEIYKKDPQAAKKLTYDRAIDIASDLAKVGINTNCSPVLDLNFVSTDKIIGDRSFGSDVDCIIDLGRETCRGFVDSGIIPVIKHIPGHGRAKCDSHINLPRVNIGISSLKKSDFRPFKELNSVPLAMTAHVLFSKLDSTNPTTSSRKVIKEIIRQYINFQGLLITDDISMGALTGSLEKRVEDSFNSGCDIVLHCNGILEEMKIIAKNARTLEGKKYNKFNRLYGKHRIANLKKMIF